MLISRVGCIRVLAGLLRATLCVTVPCQAIAQDAADRQHASPWGVATGAEWFSAFPIFNPKLRQAGVAWLRGFYEWQTIQPTQGAWDFTLPDRLVQNARDNHIGLTGVFGYFAPWASADGGTRKFPIKNIQFWRDYVAGMVRRYHDDIKSWEVWNEFNGSFAENGTPAEYAELVREASFTAKTIDPAVKIGMSVANFDVGFLDAAIKAGAAGHFDFVCVHPYEKLANLAEGGEADFLAMAGTLRRMLIANHQPKDLPLWITEIGSMAPVTRSDPADEAQATLLAKAYVLAIASGFERVFWFEARGPSYDNKGDFGLFRSDMTPRPAYRALETLTKVLGADPAPKGWLDLKDNGYGFVFDGAGGPVLAAWAPPGKPVDISFAGDVRVYDLKGVSTTLPAGTSLTLGGRPALIVGLTDDLVQQARDNIDQPYPWSGKFARKLEASAALRTINVEEGVRQVHEGTTIAGDKWRRPNFSVPDQEGRYVYFSVDPQFASFGTKELEITAVVRRVGPDKVAGMNLDYEALKGYVSAPYATIPEGDGWHELRWTIGDGNFVGAWGWNFRLNAISSPNEFLVKAVTVRKSK
jgi:hypothetical protein